MEILLEDVFNPSGIPTHTFVRPSSFNRLKVALRTPGRGVVIEGPSGIGKTTAVTKVLNDLNLANDLEVFVSRKSGDVEKIRQLTSMKFEGTKIIDDFHRLDDGLKAELADLLKVMADNGYTDRKIVLIGINEAGRSLIEYSPDLVNRIEVIRFEAEPAHKIEELIRAGERALNIKIPCQSEIITDANGSFQVAQLLCSLACTEGDILERAETVALLDIDYANVKSESIRQQKRAFDSVIRKFARGTKFRPGGLAPYLHILKWLSEAQSGSLNIREAVRNPVHAAQKASVNQILNQGYLAFLCSQDKISDLFHFNSETGILTVEDPKLTYYLRSISWQDFGRDVGFTNISYSYEYDIALSFANEDREYAKHLQAALNDLGLTVFYDQAEQHLILGEDIRSFLRPIYDSRSRFVVPILGEEYGAKIWTMFESEVYQHRYKRGEVLPIRQKGVSSRTPITDIGELSYNPQGDLKAQAAQHAQIIANKVVGQ